MDATLEVAVDRHDAFAQILGRVEAVEYRLVERITADE